MSNKNVKKMFLFLTLLILLVGIVSATNDTDTAVSTKGADTSSNSAEIQSTSSSSSQIKDSVDTAQTTENTKSDVGINKKSNNQTTKESGDYITYTTQVSSYSRLASKVEEAKELDGDEIVINLKKGTYYANSFISWGNTYQATTLVINGNGSTITGGDSESFMAVYSCYKLIVKNTTFKNFHKYGSGAVFYVNKGATLDVSTSKFISNVASSDGGAITNHGICTVDDCYFEDNDGGENGGGINNDGTLYVYDSVFYDGTATSSGGGIANFYYAYVYDTIFMDNDARGGGALYNHWDYLYVDNCYFYDNYASWNGGGVSTWGTAKIKNSIFDDNEAKTQGAAISVQDGDVYIYNNTMKDNYAEYGSAINMDDGETTVLYNTFIRNTAYYTGSNSAIRYVKNYGTLNYAGNIYSLYTLTKYEDTIYISSDSEMTLKYNDFDDRYDSSISINTIHTQTYGSTISISGRLIGDENDILSGETVDIYVNGAKISSATTSSSGYFSTSYKVTKVGKNNVTVSYDGDYYYLPDTTKTSFTVNKASTKITITPITQKAYNDDVKITGKLTNNLGTALQSVNVKVNVNGKSYTAKTNTNGVYTYTVKANKIGTNNITVSYAGNTNYLSSNNKITFKTVKATNKITVTSISQKTYDDSVKITGKFTNSKGQVYKNVYVKINYNGKIYYTKTNNNGAYTLTVKANKVGTNSIIVSHPGSTNYKASSAKTTFKTVTRATKLTVNRIATTTKGKTAIISGKFTDYRGVVLKNMNVKVSVNGKTVTVKTNSKGIFTYKYKTSVIGTNKVTITYAGSTNYKKSSVSTSFRVR